MITGEFDLIRSIRELLATRQRVPSALSGIGDDCAIYRISEGRYGLFSADMSIEGVHFSFSWCRYYDAGYRSMAANISDIHSTGGKPVHALVSLGIPIYTNADQVLEAYNGMIDCANKHGIVISGGDTVSSEKMIIGISIYGETAAPVTRSGARPGDYIYLTGSTGMSLLGYEILSTGNRVTAYPESAAKHLRPEPFDAIDELRSLYSPTAMIDISDGLLADLNHICEESGCGFELYPENIPVPQEVASYCGRTSTDPLKYLLHSGEEYQMIFTSHQKIDGQSASYIGKVIPDGKYIIINDVRTEAGIKGYDHFNMKG